ncbi:MAG: nucleotidyl transferase AbiEii/AbiGii toxin family protein, partial [Polyangiaceae bacterium]|nr:nucleotidyl transferase AbiEii/AbiGii toxin family protein [Polyangiaceae bacterium]
LYQRKKGRDLFDLWFALEQGRVNANALISCFDRYMTEEGHAVTRALFEANLHEKAGRPDFRGDMDALLRPGLTWDFDAALQVVLDELVARLPGDAWKSG